ncbi:MAG: DUF3782 domain-containing protein, partial [Armatimonadetes bacterium]|nr:DUF3782 domain-containing protein [Armatimonadota bacterium]
ALTQRMERVEAQIEALTQRMERVEAQIEALTQRMERVEAQIEVHSQILASLMERLDWVVERLDWVVQRLERLEERVGRLEERWGLVHEEAAQNLLPILLRRKGWSVSRVTPLVFDGEVDLIAQVEVGDQKFTVVAEVKGRVIGTKPFEDLLKTITSHQFLMTIRKMGYPEPIVPIVFGMVIYFDAEEHAKQFGVGLYNPHGELVEPPLSFLKGE